MPDVVWNSMFWDGSYHWDDEGEEWSAAWGGSEAQWFGAIYPRLHRAFPTNAILEIAPGFGRWTRFLLPACQQYLGIDLSARCIEACRSRFAGAGHANFLQNDGLSLSSAPNGVFDLVFSFDSLVHAELNVLAAYVPQILHKLTDTGVAFLHHSNFSALPPGTANRHLRGQSVSAANVADLVMASGGAVLVQEVINWGGPEPQDCLTLFARTKGQREPLLLCNRHFMDEAHWIREFHSRWNVVERSPSGQDDNRLVRA